MEIINNNTTELNSGLYKDNSPVAQPKGSYSFALNAINETNEGDKSFRSNEESNEICVSLKPGYIPLGKCYLGNNEVALLSVSQDNNVSEIGILKNNCTYEVHVNDETSLPEDKLNFKYTHQIDVTYRIRRGCDRTIYFTDDLNKPRYYNFDKPKDFKANGKFVATKFELSKSYQDIPKFNKIEVLDSGGKLEPGSYNISIQYLDYGQNPSEWTTTSDTIHIYNSGVQENFLDIQGSINSEAQYLAFPATTKAIKVVLENLDPNYPYYRLALISANVGSGRVNKVEYTEVIPATKKDFIFTGDNALNRGSLEEISFFNEIIYKAKNIEQVDNRLILSNTQGKQVDFCNLQKYVSRIKTDCVLKEVILNDQNSLLNEKNPIVNINGTGYMPGEIYSFGFVYIFKDGTLSPVYHIPGKNPNLSNDTVFDQTVVDGNPTVFPMSIDNSISSVYTDNQSCNAGFGYFGLDSEGEPLVGKSIRHHRFPLRTDIGVPVVSEVSGTEQVTLYYKLSLTIKGTLKTPITCEEGDTNCTPTTVPFLSVKVSYKINGEDFSFVASIDPAFYADNTGSYNLQFEQNSQYHLSDDFTDIVIEETSPTGTLEDAGTQWSNYFSSAYVEDESYKTTITSVDSKVKDKLYKTKILGVKFSGIEIPNLEDTNGEEIIGYYIVRNERTESQKTILDSAVITPCLVNEKYIGNGLLQPETNANNLSKNIYGLIHPEHKFNGKEYTEYDELIHQGNFNVTQRNKSKIMYNDVLDGSSFGEGQKEGNDDGKPADKQPRTRGYDGWSLTSINRDNILSFTPAKLFTITKAKVKKAFYLNALGDRDLDDNTKSVWNIAADNKVGMLQFNEDNLPKGNLPYVLMKRNNVDAYSTFRTLPYYKEHQNYFDITQDTCQIFHGDVHVSPMRYVNTIFWDNRVARRAAKGSRIFGTNVPGGVGKWIAAYALVALGVALIATGVGAGAGALVIGAGITVIGGAALLVSSGVQAVAVEKAYVDAYNKGLRKTSLDSFVDDLYSARNNATFGVEGNGDRGQDGPTDDTIEWVADCLTDLWFESSVNIQLRNKMTSDASTFLDAPGKIETGNNIPVGTWEYFGINWTEGNQARYPISKLDFHIAKKLLTNDSNRNDGKFYIGVPLGEYYNVNPDYLRFNKEKVFFHLSLEYDCCSKCKEDFPNRWHWSEQSFQEELTDNYRVFLPNNYKDLDGETGEIVNTFKLNNDLFMHTEEALWQIPRNYQERVTDQIISFIGTGSYGEIPAQKIVDDDTGNSAGTYHKWSAIKTPEGIFFVSENQRKIYLFNGRQLNPISNMGLTNWFQNNTTLLLDKSYYDSTGKKYKFRDNPSNPFGSGFISTYDTTKQRVIFTKKDLLFKQEILNNTDFELCTNNGQVTIFNNFQETIANELEDGWNYIGIEDCKMKFSKEVITQKTESTPYDCGCIELVSVEEINFSVCVKLISITSEDSSGEIFYRYIDCKTEEIVNDSFVDTTGVLNICIKIGSLLIINGESVSIVFGNCTVGVQGAISSQFAIGQSPDNLPQDPCAFNLDSYVFIFQTIASDFPQVNDIVCLSNNINNTFNGQGHWYKIKKTDYIGSTFVKINEVGVITQNSYVICST
jgi:hypothetical protein